MTDLEKIIHDIAFGLTVTEEGYGRLTSLLKKFADEIKRSATET